MSFRKLLSNIRFFSEKKTLDLEEYFMSIAWITGRRSEDPKSQIGACIVNEDDKIVGLGYNSFPKGCKLFPWCKDESVNNKHLYVCHAEANAIINKTVENLKNCKIFVSLFPCNECAKLIVQSGIKNIHYLSDKDNNKDTNTASKLMFESAGVTIKQHMPRQEKLQIDLNDINSSFFFL